jgi:hypothetical protein
MMIAVSFFLALAAGPMVQVPVEDPRLPAGELALVGDTASGSLYFAPGSFERSDIPGLVRGTAIMITPAEPTRPLQVARLWINCRKQVFQVSAGRAYNAEGVEIGRTAYAPDAPIPAGSPIATLADAQCAADPAVASQAFTLLKDWRAALARPTTPRTTP